MSRKRFIFHAELCIACHACEVACKTWRNPENGIKYRRIESEESGRFPDVCVQYRTVGCLHCEKPLCMKACPVNAIKKINSGSVIVNEEKCIGCRKCLNACPWNIPCFGKNGKMRKCDMCEKIIPEAMKYPCVKACPTGAFQIVIDDDL